MSCLGQQGPYFMPCSVFTTMLSECYYLLTFRCNLYIILYIDELETILCTATCYIVYFYLVHMFYYIL